jgi:hypothetical protein
MRSSLPGPTSQAPSNSSHSWSRSRLSQKAHPGIQRTVGGLNARGPAGLHGEPAVEEGPKQTTTIAYPVSAYLVSSLQHEKAATYLFAKTYTNVEAEPEQTIMIAYFRCT